MAKDFSWHHAALHYQELYVAARETHQRARESALARARDLQNTEAKISALPKRIARLRELAYNLWWSWNEGASAFADVDRALWATVKHNPIAFLREVNADALIAASRSENYLQRFDALVAAFDAYHGAKATWFNTNFPYGVDHPIAYFSAEFGLHESLPIYSGGLGILSGDHTKEASDLGLPFVGVGFLYPQGYFTQSLAADGSQIAQHAKLNFALAPALPAKNSEGREVVIGVGLPGRSVYAKVWRIQVGRVPLFLMDTDFDANAPADRELLARLYQGDQEMRIAQEIILGVGGVRALRALGIAPRVWHLNEGHSTFSVLERTREWMEQGKSFEDARQAVRAETVFTTHTPVAAGNDAFPRALMEKYFGAALKRMNVPFDQFFEFGRLDGMFSMTVLALKFAGHANGVSQLHGEVARKMWSFLWQARDEKNVPIDSITNGVHTFTWLAPEYQNLYDESLPRDWRARVDDAEVWRAVEKIADEKIWQTHCALKDALMDLVRARHLLERDPNNIVPSITQPNSPQNRNLANASPLLLGFARRFATYKRATLMFRDLERLKKILNDPARPAQIIFAGKAHPADEPGKELVKQVAQFTRANGLVGKIFFAEDYDIDLARNLVQGVDVWVNTPRRPLEASGTSGMKAALNGALNFSVLDGWWREGFVQDQNGWAIGEDKTGDDHNAQDAADADSFYAILENEIVPLFYTRDERGVPREWVRRMKQAIRTLAPQFSARRMLKEYVTRYYVPTATR
ncbi:MAG: alpha-glucan family phosphorylase [Chloroflexi bacterium]|nr:alpha-glucan family phosphorylase [Chloroflexota bacterium]